MYFVSLVWTTTPVGTLSAETCGYFLFVERLLPSAEAQFAVWKADAPDFIRVTGVERSTKDAMRAAEVAAIRLAEVEARAS